MEKEKTPKPNTNPQPTTNKNTLIITAVAVGVVLVIGISVLVYNGTQKKTEDKKKETTSETKKVDIKAEPKTQTEDEANVKLPTVTPPDVETPGPNSFTNEEFTIIGAGQEFRLLRKSDNKYYWVKSNEPNLPAEFSNSDGAVGTKTVTFSGKFKPNTESEDFKNDFYITEVIKDTSKPVAPMPVDAPPGAANQDNSGDWEKVTPQPANQAESEG
jgi:hypothetical protein